MKPRDGSEHTYPRIPLEEEGDTLFDGLAVEHAGMTLYAKPVVCESTIGYAVYSEEGAFLAFVDSMGVVMLATHSLGVHCALVH